MVRRTVTIIHPNTIFRVVQVALPFFIFLMEILTMLIVLMVQGAKDLVQIMKEYALDVETMPPTNPGPYQ
jgi:hypothetical protein